MSRERLTGAAYATALTTALTVVVIDEVTKTWARRALAHHQVHVLGPLWLRLQFNSGVSFSITPSGPLATTVVTAVVAMVILGAALRARRGAPAYVFGLMLGGGVANVVDRLAASPHRVTDFIALGAFPVFNGADVAVTGGFIVLIVVALRGGTLLRR